MRSGSKLREANDQRLATNDFLMFERLSQLEARYEELTQALASPEVINDSAKYQKTAKAHSEITPIVEKYREYKDLTRGITESKALLADETDADMRTMIKGEIAEQETVLADLEAEIKELLLPRDPNEGRNVIVEIQGAEGGEEANLWAGDLFRMYQRFAESQGLKIEVLSSQPSEHGGFRDVTFVVKGPTAWSRFKYEGGPHRVQRVPVVGRDVTQARHAEPGRHGPRAPAHPRARRRARAHRRAAGLLARAAHRALRRGCVRDRSRRTHPRRSSPSRSLVVRT